MKIHELFDRDPRRDGLVNNGQARIEEVVDQQTQRELRAELETFVCDGRFADALLRILERFVANYGRTRQESAWISGFFGSGKSHLLKMLTHLWRNTKFDDGATARSLVPGGLPSDIAAALRELDTLAARAGKPAVAAAGTLLGGNAHARSNVLAILLRACRLPTLHPLACFCFWLRDEGALDKVRDQVEARGKDWLAELNNLYVSPLIARALLDALPGFASDEKSVRLLLREQFPQVATADITTEQLVAAVRLALAPEGELPPTLLALDEVQQYVHEEPDRATAITEMAEALQTGFDGRIMLVGAGQSALSSGTQALAWLRDRFPISAQLTDADVEAVTRHVLLRKKPSAKAPVEHLLESSAGEIARHLAGTKLAARQEDAAYAVDDYPLLITRRRFWEACFQAVDVGGGRSQLRSQLRILRDSLNSVAGRELGAVIPASDLYNALADSLVASSVLPREFHERVGSFDDGTAHGRLRRNLCGLAFLIGKLPREAAADTGARADAPTLADVLLDDLTADSGPFRKQVEDALEKLAEEGALMKVGAEYRLQTTEGAAWEQAFRERQAALRQDTATVEGTRERLFSTAVKDLLATVRVMQGQARLRRSLALHVGSEAPNGTKATVHVWLRDGWSCSETEAMVEARRCGPDDPVLHLFVPRRSAERLRNSIVDTEAASQVLDLRGAPGSAEGREARQAMQGRLAAAKANRDQCIRDLLQAARLLQGGGTEVEGTELSAKIESGMKSSLARLHPRFAEADHGAWETALRRARDGSSEPLKAVGWEEATERHPVAKEVFKLTTTGVRGSEIQKKLGGPPCGWPQDAIDAVLIALHRDGQLRTLRNGQPVVADALDQAGVKSAEFRTEQVVLGIGERIALRGLFLKLGVNATSGNEGSAAPDFLQALIKLAERVGGKAPLPSPPDIAWVKDFVQLAGSERLKAILDSKDRIGDAADKWQALADRTQQRLSSWELVQSLCSHAVGLPVQAEVASELAVIESQRLLLAEPDPIAPLTAKLASALREALTAAHRAQRHTAARAAADLAEDATWAQLPAESQSQLIRQHGLEPAAELDLSTDAALKDALDARSLSAWQATIDAIATRSSKALEEAAEQLAKSGSGAYPNVVSIHQGTLRDEAAVRDWVREHERILLEAVQKGPVIVR